MVRSITLRADQIKQALAKRHFEDFFMTEVKNGPTHSVKNHLKLDALAIKRSWVNPCIMGYEVKVSRSDFQRDDKWPGYLPYCNQFSFVCPTGLIKPEELPQEVGLIYYNPETNSLFTKRKALYRLIEEPVNMYKYLIMSRLDKERHPFFSSKREYFEAYLQDKEESIWLGKETGSKLRDENIVLKIKLDNANKKVEANEPEIKLMERLRKILKEHGVGVYKWNDDWVDELSQALSAKANPNTERMIKRLLSAADELKRVFETEEAAT